MTAAKSLSLLNSIEFLLKIEKGPDKGKVYRIHPPKIEVGRDPATQIVVTDPKASRKQCSIIIKDDVLLVDESSRGTTLVNGQSFSQHKLMPGDIITFGDTEMQFMAKSANKPAKPQLKGAPSKPTVSPEKQESRKKFLMFVAVIVVLIAALFAMEETIIKKEKQLVTSDQLEQQIEDSEKRQAEYRENKMKSLGKREKRRQLLSVEQHFVKGFRDLQTGRYGNALDSFDTTIATDSNHQRAKQYAQIARKKQADLIDTHMRDGVKYKNKKMYKRCIGELEKAIVLINNKKDRKFRIAKTQLDECRLLKSGGF